MRIWSPTSPRLAGIVNREQGLSDPPGVCCYLSLAAVGIYIGANCPMSIPQVINTTGSSRNEAIVRAPMGVFFLLGADSDWRHSLLHYDVIIARVVQRWARTAK